MASFLGASFRVAMFGALAMALVPSPAIAQTCVPATCAAMYSNICYPNHQCLTTPYGSFCVGNMGFTAAGTACETDNNPCTSDVCGANGASGNGLCQHNTLANGTSCGTNQVCTSGSCACASGYKVCGAACIANATCCTNADCPGTANGAGQCSGAGGSCSVVCNASYSLCAGACIPSTSCCTTANCPPPANGSAVCSGAGGSCTVTCNTGYKVCNSTCIANAMCCKNTDCPNDPANHRSGVCGAGGCAFACDAGYKVCGATCIPTANCCNAAGCVTPPNGCYKTQGSCTSGACSYEYNDGAACNADSTACTPNDKCASGTCVADTAHLVKCIQRACHTAPACNPSTGNCDDTSLANGTACGGNSCTPAGTCTTGNCSSATKDCSSLSTTCKAGLCDPALAAPNNCAATNVVNGTPCTLTDKCQLTTACSGGSCVGTPKVCTPSAICRVSLCNGSTGACEETLAPIGSPCTSTVACAQNASCDATGNCVGVPVPDGTPCDNTTCTATAACVANQCICIEGAGLVPNPVTPGDAPDMSVPAAGKSGCSAAGPFHARGSFPAALLLLGVAVVWRRRRVQA